MIGRIFLYLRETFRLPTRLLLVLTITVIIFLFQQVKFEPQLFIISSLVMLTAFLHFRIADEFKDEKADKVFFPNRPYPSGRVQKKDLITLVAGCILIQSIAIILYPASRHLAFVLLVHSLLIHFGFFMPEKWQQRKIVLLFLEISICFSIYIYIISLVNHGSSAAVYKTQNFGLLLALALPTFHWEVIRKTFYINKPGYPSYSKELTYAGAILFSLWFFFPLALGLWLILDSELYIPLISIIIIYGVYIWGLGLNEREPPLKFQALAELLYIVILAFLTAQGIFNI